MYFHAQKSNMAEKTRSTHVPLWRSYRGILCLTGMIGFLIMYLLRINLSIAMVCMVKGPSGNSSSNSLGNSSANIASVISYNDTCGQLNSERKDYLMGEFEWGKPLQGYILSSFYYGYIVSQIPGGWLASQVGGKHVLGIGMLVSIMATLLIPVGARAHPGVFIALRVIMGLGMGVVFPSMHGLFGRWAPPLERTKMVSFTYAGTMVGTVAAMSLSGLLCASTVDNGWPLIFYVFGAVGVLWWISWNVFAYSSPSKHPWISDAERDYIDSSINVGSWRAKTQRVATPWKAILTSGPVWAIITAHACNNWGSYTILSCIPMYMKEVLRFDVKQNGLLSALPYVCMFIVAIAGGQVADLLRARKVLSTATVRKLFQVIAFCVPAILICVMGYMDCERRVVAVALLTLTVTFTAFGRSGYSVSHVDIAPRFAGFLFGISNTAATIPGMVAPTIASALTPNGTREEWQRVFFICGGVYLFGAFVFTILASGEEQPWATPVSVAVAPTEDERVQNDHVQMLKENTSSL